MTYNFSEADNALELLASILSRNLVTSSFGILDYEEHKLGKKILSKASLTASESPSRNILIIGAGASYSLNKKIPLATGVIEKVEENFKNKYGQRIKNLQEDKIAELTQVYRLPEKEFETELLAFSLIDKQLVLDVLKAYYNLKYPVSLFYEIVAHLFKHRFIDVIINFNFDEMLDNAIEEEMVDSQHKFIFSDGHCPDDIKELLNNNRLAFPVYIKPHGTISHESTLRFTRADYYHMPLKIKQVIEFLIEASISYTAYSYKKNQPVEKLPVNLIVAGFGLKSHEFNKILTDNLDDERCQLFYFNDFTGKHGKPYRFSEELGFISDPYLFPIAKVSLDDWFLKLWLKIKDNFAPSYQPKEISRHVIIHELFNPVSGHLISIARSKTESWKEEQSDYTWEDYLRDRIYVELAIEILNSSDGLINLRQLSESRVNKYFSELKKKKNKESIFTFLSDFDLAIYKGYVKDTWYFDPNDDNFKKHVRRTVLKHLSNVVKTQIRKNARHSNRLDEYVLKLSAPKKLFLNIQSSSKDSYVSLFQFLTSESFISTDIKWVYTFQNYFLSKKENREWNLVLSISETGGMFNTVKTHLEGKKIMQIGSYDSMIGKNERRQFLLEQKLQDVNKYILRNEGQEEVRMLPFRNHNQHAVIFVDVDVQRNRLKPHGGIYYGRRNLSKRVKPVHITHKADLEELLSVFLNYWDRACREDQLDILKEAFLNKRPLSDSTKFLDLSENRSIDELKNEIIRLFKSNS